MIGKSRNVKDSVRDLIETRGLKAAAMALIEVCENKDAPAPARATAGTTLFRAGGLFEKTVRHEDKDLHELSGEELSAAVQRIREDLSVDDASSLESEDDDEGVHG